MTIYAITDGLTHAFSGQTPRHEWTLISGSGILQGGNPYFVPDFAEKFEGRPALAIKIGKLGKGIATRFAGRYVDSVAPALLFVADDLLKDLHHQGLPWTRAMSYDRCLALGKFKSKSLEELKKCTVGVTVSGNGGSDSLTLQIEEGEREIAEIISTLSRDNTLKTGDIILAGLSHEGIVAKQGLSASLQLDGTESLHFNIR